MSRRRHVWEDGSSVLIASNRLLGSIEQLAMNYGAYTDPAQTLFASTSNGQLLEITVPVDDPQSETMRVVAAEGFGDLTALSVHNCWSGDGRLFAGATDAGDIVAWFDADRTNGTAAIDLVRIETGVALEPGDRAYSIG